MLIVHVERFVDASPDAFVFLNTDGGPINLSNFSRDVWNDARNDVFHAGSPPRRVRRHDLRHSAITAWLDAGVPPASATDTWVWPCTAFPLVTTAIGSSWRATACTGNQAW
jgi:integrase